MSRGRRSIIVGMEEPKIKKQSSFLSAKSAELFLKKNKKLKVFSKGLAKEMEALYAQELRIKELGYQISKPNPSHKIRPKDLDAYEPFAIPAFFMDIDKSKYGSMAEEIEALCAQALRVKALRAQKSKLQNPSLEIKSYQESFPSDEEQASHSEGHSFTQPLAGPTSSSLSEHPITEQEEKVFINLENDNNGYDDREKLTPILIIDSEDEDHQVNRYTAKDDSFAAQGDSPHDIAIAMDACVGNCSDIKVSGEEMDIEKDNYQISAAVECLPQFCENMAYPEDDPKVESSEKQVQGKDASRSHDILVSMYESVDKVNGSLETKNSKEEVGGLPSADFKTASPEEQGTPNMDVKIGLPAAEVDCVSLENMRIIPSLNVGTDRSFYGMDKMVIEESNIEEVDDDLAHLWKELTFSLECSKDICDDSLPDKNAKEDEGDCEHLVILKDDVGYVCRICGLIQRGIENIFEFVYSKGNKSRRTYLSGRQNSNKRGMDEDDHNRVKSSEKDVIMTEVFAHPKHWKQMKTHQMEGFNFLCRNLLVDHPGGCILAHAPGSGKTFMIISFVQSFLAKNPQGKPLVILPKGILATWKREFQLWQVEDIPLLDFYTSKAENRSQQLDVLKQWVNQKSILFLGYQQFSAIVRDDVSINKVSADCRDILLKEPSILILDEGHTPRNENTSVIHSLAMVKTPLKVVLSGTLYQNNVKEVFNILNLVRPKFLMSKTSQAIVARIMSRAQIPAARKQFKVYSESAFFDSVENTLQKDDDFERKIAVIKDLRDMTREVLHYYKGDFLDELPGLVDLTVVLNMSRRQKDEVKELRKLNRFKQYSVGSAVYVHPDLLNVHLDDESIDEMLETLDVKHGVKLKFFLHILGLCESTGEKLLVFSQFILPLKVLERFSMKLRGWRPGKELFMITGDSSSEHRESSMEQFNKSPDAKVLFGSIKACGEGISLVGASRVLILDVHLNPSVTRQAIGRAFRPGQKKKVYTYRLVAADSPEVEDYQTCFKKEMISKMWFEWNERCGHQDFKVATVDADECDDPYMESSVLRDDLKVLYKR